MAKVDKVNTTNTTKTNTAAATTAARNKAVVLSTTEDTGMAKAVEENNSTVCVACFLQGGIKFQGLKTRVKDDGVFVFPGINHDRANFKGGALALPGNGICISVPKDVWEEIKQVYGSLEVFTHQPPFLFEVASKKEFDTSDEIKAVKKDIRTGAEPVDPQADANVQPAE